MSQKALSSQLLAYAYQRGLKATDRFFNLNRKNAHKMLVKAAKLAGLNQEGLSALASAQLRH
jgi:hypothetical protein